MKAYKTAKEDSNAASGGSRRFGRFFFDENISESGCQCDTGAQRVTQWARGLPAAAAAGPMASLDDAVGRTGRSRAAPTASRHRQPAKRCFGAGAGSERSGTDESY